MYDTIQKVIAYSYSKHISGEKDSLGRVKPFFDIGTASANLWYRATDLDRKDVKIKGDKKNYFKAFVASLLLREWMRREGFGLFLNSWGRKLAQFGSAIVEFVEKSGNLNFSVLDWNRVIVDPVDVESAPIIKLVDYTPAELRNNKQFNQDLVEEAIKCLTTREDLEGQQIDNLPDYVQVYEVHGNLPLAYLTAKEKDETTYRNQMHVIFIHEDEKDKEKNKELTLYSGKEAQSPHMNTHLIPIDGRSLSIGSYEHSFQAQWQVNHSIKAIRDQLDFTSKMILQTADDSFEAKNVLTEVETGSILHHAEGKPLTQVNNTSHDTTALVNYATQWRGLQREITGTFESVTGETMPSGTPYSSVALLNQEAGALFGIMRENKALYLEEMIRRYVLPYFKKKLNSTEEIAPYLTSDEIEEIDRFQLSARLKEELNKYFADGSRGEVPTEASVRQALEEENAIFGQKRFIAPSRDENKTWKEYFKDFEFDVQVETSNEEQDKNVVIQTLSTIFQTVASNPQILQDPNARKIFNKILEESSVLSPLEFKTVATPAPAPQGEVVPPQSINPINEEII